MGRASIDLKKLVDVGSSEEWFVLEGAGGVDKGKVLISWTWSTMQSLLQGLWTALFNCADDNADGVLMLNEFAELLSQVCNCS